MFDDLYPEARKAAFQARVLRGPEPEPAPGVWTGVAKGAGMGAMKGFAEVARNAAIISQAPTIMVEKALGAEGVLSDSAFKFIDEHLDSAVKWWEPQPDEVGVAGQVLGAVANFGAKATAGGAPSLVANEQVSLNLELLEKGASPEAAFMGGVSRGMTTAVGLRLPPALGTGRVSSAAIGAAVNPAIGIYDRLIIANLLKEDGLHKVAEQYKPLDPLQLGIDAAFGAVFGAALGKPGAPRVPNVAVREAAQTAHAHLELQRSKMLPADAFEAERALQLNAEADARALAGEKLVVHPDTPLAPALVEEAGRRVALGSMPRAAVLDDAGRNVESALAERVALDFPGARQAYEMLDDPLAGSSADGRILNTDLARELSPEYRADRTLSAAVHEPASWFIKQLYAQKLAEAPEGSAVTFTAGGTGAGKSTAIDTIAEVREIVRRSAIVYDTNMNKLASSVEKIEAALAAGKRVNLIYVHRNPVEALVQGALPRAMRMGRTVPLAEHLRTHVGAAEVIGQLADRYKGHPRVVVSVIDNTRGKNKAALSDLSLPAREDYNGLREQLQSALETERAAGRISEAVYRGTAGVQNGRGVPGLGQEGGAGRGGQPEPQRQRHEPPAVAQARQAFDALRASGGDTRQFLEAAKLPPEVSNLVVGLSEAGSDAARAQRMLDDFGRAIDTAPARSPVDVAADAVEASRSGRTITPEPNAQQVPPEIAAARQALAELPDAEIPVGMDETGAVIKQRAADAINDAEATLRQAQNDVKAFDAAVSCFLRG